MPYQTEHVREANRHGVYRALARCGVATRTELAQVTGLSSPTVAAILAEFHAHGIVVEAGTDEGTGGRPAQRVRFEANAAHVLAVDLSDRHARACRIDLTGRVLARQVGPALAPGATEDVLAWLGPLVREGGSPQVRRVALAVPGVVDPDDGHVDLAPALGWHAVDVAARFEADLGVGVRLENDVNALALAELHYGAGAAHRHVLYVAIGSGVGAGVVIDGRLYRGAHAAAGEIGSIVACSEDEARPLAPGQPGPLERRVVEAAGGCLDDDGYLDDTSPAARCAFDDLVRLLGPTLHNLACLLDPELLVVAWPADRGGRLAERIRESWRGPWPLRIVPGALGPDGAARGVAHLALEDLEADICRHRAGGGTFAEAAAAAVAAPLDAPRGASSPPPQRPRSRHV